ncbi:MAG: cupin domain-containing protein [bacterium]|nr:cupin domain-containing protein [bacterium]
MEETSVRVFEAGEFDSWSDFRLEIPGLPPAAKCFLKDRIGMNSMEVSLNSMAPGTGMPFVHRHRENEELYIFLSGHGQFQADGKLLPISPGTCICCAPAVKRAWGNLGDEPLLFIVIQTPNQKMAASNIHDGEVVDETLIWREKAAG